MAVIKRFIPLEGVKKGDLLLTYDGTEEVVESIEFVPSTEDVYNLEVSGNHNYYAEGILVHNKWGSWKGKDKTTRAAVGADVEAWTATMDSINLLNERAQRLTSMEDPEDPEGVAAKEGEIYDVELESKRRDFIAQKSAAEFQAGQSGMVSGTATTNIAKAGEAFQADIQMGKTAQEVEGEVEEFGLENSLYDIAQKQSNLYAGYLSNMQSSALGGTAPTYTSTYGGGENWSKPAFQTELGQMGLGCFPADIKVDGKEISKIEIGDMVSSYNEESETMEKAEVIETFRHKYDDGYLVINGRIRATANHPFYIRRNV